MPDPMSVVSSATFLLHHFLLSVLFFISFKCVDMDKVCTNSVWIDLHLRKEIREVDQNALYD